jgi:hypothetical protein
MEYFRVEYSWPKTAIIFGQQSWKGHACTMLAKDRLGGPGKGRDAGALFSSRGHQKACPPQAEIEFL